MRLWLSGLGMMKYGSCLLQFNGAVSSLLWQPSNQGRNANAGIHRDMLGIIMPLTLRPLNMVLVLHRAVCELRALKFGRVLLIGPTGFPSMQAVTKLADTYRQDRQQPYYALQ